MIMDFIKKDFLIGKLNKFLRDIQDESSFRTIRSETAKEIVTRIIDFVNSEDGNPEIDIEKEINDYISEHFFGSETMGFFSARTKEEPDWKDIASAAKHFYILGKSSEK